MFDKGPENFRVFLFGYLVNCGKFVKRTFKYCRWWGLLAQLLTTGTQLNSSALLNGGTSAPLLAIYCWQQLILVR